MSVEVTIRHRDSSDSIQEYAREKAEQITAEFPRIEHLHMILDQEKKRQIAEIVVQAKNHIRLEAAESSMNMRVSIDEASDKIVRRLRRLRDKVQDRSHAMKEGEARRDEVFQGSETEE